MRDAGILGLFGICAAILGAFVLWHGAVNAPSNEFGSIAVPFTELASGTVSSVTERKNYLITSRPELRELWKLIGTDIPLPDVDFSKTNVIAVFSGTEPAAGYRISVDNVSDGSSRMVTVLLTSPGVFCLPAETPTEPYAVIVVPATTLPLTHEDIATTTKCI